MKPMPKTFFSGEWKAGHVQGIALDMQRGYVYYSFTTILVKTDFEGRLIGTVQNLTGHLGCIVFDADRNCVYGSIEYKHDSIGKGVQGITGAANAEEDAFYLVQFDADRIDRVGMDAETSGVMLAVYLADVVRDYGDRDEASGEAHRYGCSGIDGTGYGPVFGAPKNSPKKLMVAYGIYSDVMRSDNDYQVILQYDPSIFERFGQPLSQLQPHHSGPQSAEERYFVYTGNTTYGIQNLEYDAYTQCWFAAVYPGKKEQFANSPFFAIDGTVEPEANELKERTGEIGKTLRLATFGVPDANGIYGIPFSGGSTGLFACGDGSYYISIPNRTEGGASSCVERYVIDPSSTSLFRIEE